MLDARLVGTLATQEATTLVLSQGNVALTQGGATQKIDELVGTLRIPDSGKRIEFDEVSALLSSTDAGLQATVLTITGSADFGDERIQVAANGTIDNTAIETSLSMANASGAIDGEVDIKSQGLPAGIDHAPFTPEALFPLSLSSAFAYADNTLELSNLKLDSPKNALSGTLSLSTTAPWKLIANLQAPRLYFPLVTGESTEEEAPQDEPAEVAQEADAELMAATDTDTDTEASEEETSRLFDDAPVDWSWLATAEIDAKLAAQELALQDATFTDLNVALKNADGTLSLNPLSATLGSGGFNGSAELQLTNQASEQAPIKADAAFELAGVNLESFGLVPTEELSGGKVEADIGLTTSGNSIAELAAGLNGEILMMVEDATLMNDFIEVVGSDLVTETLNKLNPFAKQDPTTELSCALVRFTAEDGKLTTKNQLVMETSKMEIVANGNVNLNNEKISLEITPNAKSGIGINIGSAVKFLKLGGTLSAPRPAVSAGGLLKSGLAIGAAISTGGASVVAEGLAKRALNAGSACEAVRNTEDTAPSETTDPVEAPQG